MRSLSPWGIVWLCCAMSCPVILTADCMSELHYLVDCLSTNDQAYLEKTYQRYTQSGQHETQKMLERIPIYAADIDAAFQQQNIPDWIKYLPLAESRLQAQAVSPAGAAGIWQIMPSTGRSLGLRINESLDERLHTGRASQAAAYYLKQLHYQFGDWLLALAAYNCGPGNVRKAQRRSRRYFYHEISSYLPRQTRRYIPRVLAIAMIAEQPSKYGFTQIRPSARPVIMTSTKSTSLRELADYFSCSLSLLKQFNPTYAQHKVIQVEGQTTAEIYIPASVFHYSKRRSPLQISAALQLQEEINLRQLIVFQKRDVGLAQRHASSHYAWHNLLATVF